MLPSTFEPVDIRLCTDTLAVHEPCLVGMPRCCPFFLQANPAVNFRPEREQVQSG
jgi:hypothetical protein